MKPIKKIFIYAATVLLALSFMCTGVSATSYTYSKEGNPVGTPDAVDVEFYLDKEYSNWGKMGLIEPSDLAVAPNGDVYIADTGNNRIAVLDSDFQFKGQIATPLLPDRSLGRIAEPKGVFVDENGLIYIADTGNNQVLACDENGVVSRVLTASGEDVFDSEFVFRPIKIAADVRGNVYVLSEGAYDGLMQFDAKNNFVGFVGANDVSTNLWDSFWKEISTAVQRGKMVKSLPVEFDNLDIDSKGFIYTVTSPEDSVNPTSGTPIRRQSALGVNILKSSTIYGQPVGDINFNYWDDATFQGASKLVDIAVRDYGYLCLDSNRKRIFAYSDNGDPLYVFGGYGSEAGKFINPVAIDAHDEYIYVLDASTLSVTVFKLNEYGNLIINAQQNYIDGNYEASKENWLNVLRFNSQLNIAYSGIGKVYYMLGEYDLAMDYAKLGGDKSTYSKAYGLRTQDFFSENLGVIILGVLLVAALVVASVLFIRKKSANKTKSESPEWVKGLKYSFYIMTHPFDGFWDMTHERRGNNVSVAIIYFVWVMVWIANAGLKGFLYKEINQEFSLIKTISVAVLPVILWCICNWAVSTLLDGDGKPSHIIMATAYALVPLMLCQIPCVILSNLLTLEGGMFITVISGFGVAWTAILLVASVITVHNYTLKRTVGVIILILCAMAIVVFLAVLVFNLLDQMRYFLINLYKEIVINM